MEMIQLCSYTWRAEDSDEDNMADNITASLVLKIIFISIFLGLQVTDNVFLFLLFTE